MPCQQDKELFPWRIVIFTGCVSREGPRGNLQDHAPAHLRLDQARFQPIVNRPKVARRFSCSFPFNRIVSCLVPLILTFQTTANLHQARGGRVGFRSNPQKSACLDSLVFASPCPASSRFLDHKKKLAGIISKRIFGHGNFSYRTARCRRQRPFGLVRTAP